MSHRVQFHEVCDAHLAHPEYTPLLKVHKLVQCCKVIWKNFTSLLKQRGLTSKFPKTICRYIFQEIVSEDCVSLYSIFAFKHLGPPIFKPIGGWPSPSRKYLKKFFFCLLPEHTGSNSEEHVSKTWLTVWNMTDVCLDVWSFVSLTEFWTSLNFQS